MGVISLHLIPSRNQNPLVVSINNTFNIIRSKATDTQNTSELVESYFRSVKTFINDPQSEFWYESAKVPLVTQLEQRMTQGQPLLAHQIRIPDAIVSDLCELYISLDTQGKEKFFQVMASEFGSNQEVVWQEIKKIQSASEAQIVNFHSLRKAMIPLYEKFFDHLIKQPNGMQLVLSMRKDLLDIIFTGKQNGRAILPELEVLEQNLHMLLSSWFSLAFLNLCELTWDSPVSILEKIIKGERVHKFGDIDPEINLGDQWQDLKRRVALGNSPQCERRRLFSFVHPNMSSEPVVFVQVACLDQIPVSMKEVLPKNDNYYANPPSKANTVVFYSINATQPGLRGIELGNFLIKRVVKEILRDTPNIKTFCTLSPIPGLSKWLFTKLEMHLSDITQKFKDESLLTSKDIDNLLKIIPKEAQGNPYLGFKLMLQQQQQQQSPIPLPLKDIMLRLATKYLYKEKRRGRVIDSVANFHIRNGARMYRVNLNADLSKIRIKESFGIMVNYEYVLEDIESNNRDYILDGKVKASEQFLQNVY